MATLKQIDNKIATFTTNRAKLQTLGHEIALMVFKHAAPKDVDASCDGTGDCTRAIKLAQAMPKSWAAQVEAWFKEFTPIRVVTKNGKCEYDPAYKKLDKAEKVKHWNLEGANVTPFYEVIEEPGVAKPFELDMIEKRLKALISQAEKKIEAGEAKEADVASIKSTIEALKAFKVIHVPAANDETTVTELPAPIRAARRSRVKAA